MKRAFAPFLLVFVLLMNSARAQSYFLERLPNTPGRADFVTSIVPTDSGYAAFGETFYTATATYGTTFRLLDSTGQQRRITFFNAPGASFGGGIGHSLERLADGGYMAAGPVFLPSGANGTRLWRFDARGDTLWTSTFFFPVTGRQPNGGTYSLCRTRDGGYALVGTVEAVLNELDFWLIRTDSAGTLLWQQTYHSTQNFHYGYSIAQLADGGFVLGGFCNDGNGILPQYTYQVRTDSMGTKLQEWRLGDARWLNGLGEVCATRDGGWAMFASVGKQPVGSQRFRRAVVYKYDAAGTQQWRREIGPDIRSADAIGLVERADGQLVGLQQEGFIRGSSGTGAVSAALFALCPDGDSLWYRNHRILPASDNYPRALNTTPDGGFVGGGFLHVFAPDTGTPDAWVFKTDSAGYLLPGGAPPSVTCIPLGLAPEAPAENIGQAWPNPAREAVTITYRLPAGRVSAELVLLDGVGRVCARQQLAGAAGEVVLPLAGLAPGVYAYRVRVGDKLLQTGKIVKLP